MSKGRPEVDGHRLVARLPAILLGLIVTLVVATLVGRITNADLPLGDLVPDVVAGASLLDAAAALLFAVPGWFLARKRPEVAFGWLALGAGLAHGLGGLGFEWVVAAQFGGRDLPAPWIGSWLANWGPLVELPVLATAYALFPDGRFVRGWLRWASMVAIGLVVAGVLVTVFDPFPLPASSDDRLAELGNPIGLPGLEAVAESPEVLIAPGMILATALVVVRWARARGEQRRVLSWLALLSSLTIVIVPSVVLLPPAVGGTIAAGTTFLEVAVIVAAVLRHRVYGIDVVLNRTLVYAVLTALAALVYGVAIAAGAAFGDAGSAWWSFIGALAVGLVLMPARLRVQRLVNRFLYGERDEPFVVVNRVAGELAAAGSAEALLSDFVAEVRSALQVPYVALRTRSVGLDVARGGADHDGGGVGDAPADGRRIGGRVFEAGPSTGDAAAYPLVHGGRSFGELLVARRRGEAEVGPAERRLIEHLAGQAAVAAANLALTDDLRRARERTVLAREEERRRLRRDLHDGLGPHLTGVALGLDVAAERVGSADPAVGADLDGLRHGVEDAIEEIRRLAHDLRPPRLDDVGLASALEELAERVSRGGLRVVVRRPERLPELDAAAETAAYRIAAEAVTNVTRHAGATRCEITLAHCVGRLRLSVADDGRGLAPSAPHGTGRASMRERAEEIGGAFQIADRPGGGCLVEVDLPVVPAP